VGLRADDDVFAGTYTVVERATGEAVGMVGTKGGPDADGAQEIGYGVNPSAWGRGYATEAVRALVAHLLSDDEIRTVTALTATGNVASQRVLEKLGFVRTGTAWSEEDGDLIAWATGRA
jgi:ribosomal-protein-alanine N-acetyltransferase